MGNCSVTKDSSMLSCGNGSNVNSKRINLCTNRQGTSTKYLLYKSIQQKDLETTKKLYAYFNIDPNEELSVEGYRWTALHYAAYFDATTQMDFFLKLIYFKFPEHYSSIVNLQTREGYTPIMVAAIHGKQLILKQILKAGGIKLNLKDKKGKTAKDLAIINGYLKCAEIISEFECDESPTPLNYNYLKNFSLNDLHHKTTPEAARDIEDDPRYQEILLKGRRIPCIICQDELGLTKYTTCCGQPLHAACIEGKVKTCPICKCGGLELINEILYPERAFEL